MLDDLGLVHMNGRIYDARLGRFLSADPYIKEPMYLQSFNRYSYGYNNPLSGTDPSGYFWKELWNWFSGNGWTAQSPNEGLLDNSGIQSIPTDVVPKYLSPSWEQHVFSLAIAQGYSVEEAVNFTAQVIAGIEKYYGDELNSMRVRMTDEEKEFLTLWASYESGEISANEFISVIASDDKLQAVGKTFVERKAIANGVELLLMGAGYALAVRGPRMVNPGELRWTQRTAGGNGRAADMRQSMSAKGWDGPAIDVVRTPDGLVTLDHTRAAIAIELGIDKIPVNIHAASEALPASMSGRFGASKTWGEAAAFRAGNQRPPLPSSGTTTLPILPRE